MTKTAKLFCLSLNWFQIALINSHEQMIIDSLQLDRLVIDRTKPIVLGPPEPWIKKFDSG